MLAGIIIYNYGILYNLILFMFQGKSGERVQKVLIAEEIIGVLAATLVRIKGEVWVKMWENVSTLTLQIWLEIGDCRVENGGVLVQGDAVVGRVCGFSKVIMGGA